MSNQSNHIIGARVKAAAGVHAHKQLQNLGFRFMPSSGTVEFSGSTAYAGWRPDLNDPGRIDMYHINYPELADNSIVSRAEADLIAAYTLHELGHVAFTGGFPIDDEQACDKAKMSNCSCYSKSCKSCKRAAVTHHLYNGIEDGRIEHAMIASGRAQGARSMFKKLMSKFTGSIAPKFGTQSSSLNDFDPTSINHAPFALALISRAAFGDGNGFAKRLLARIPEPYYRLYAAASEGIRSAPLDRSGSKVALDLARNFLSGWLVIDPAILDGEQPPEDPTGVSSSPGESGGNDELTESVADQLSSWDLKPAEDAETAANREAMLDAMEDAPADSILGRGFANCDDDDEEGDENNAPFKPRTSPDRFDPSKALIPEPNVDDVFKAIKDRTANKIQLAEAGSTANRSHMARWQNIPEANDRAMKKALKDMNRHTAPALKAQLYRVLKAPERCGWDGGAMGGRFDVKRSPRLIAGSERVFRRRWFEEGINTAVSIVVDLSGSMRGTGIKEAVYLAWTIACACESARADVEVLGFCETGRPVHSGGTALYGGYVPGATSNVILAVAKRFTDTCASTVRYFQKMLSLPSGGTPDYSACKTVVEQLSAKPHQRKIVIVLTDGCGDMANMNALGAASWNLYGVDVIGFGIEVHPEVFARAYPLGSPVSLNSLHKTGLKSIIKQLELRDKRRIM